MDTVVIALSSPGRDHHCTGQLQEGDAGFRGSGCRAARSPSHKDDTKALREVKAAIGKSTAPAAPNAQGNLPGTSLTEIMYNEIKNKS